MIKEIYFETYLAGTTHKTIGDPQLMIKEIAEVGDELTLLRDNENKFDPCAIGVFDYKYLKMLEKDSVAFLGWIPSELNREIVKIFRGALK